MSSPTKRSLALLRKQGFDVGIVEKWNQWAKVRQDLFGFIDLVAMKPGHGIYGIQTTSRANMAARRKKIQASDLALTWKASGGVILLHGWQKNRRTGRWEVLVEKL